MDALDLARLICTTQEEFWQMHWAECQWWPLPADHNPSEAYYWALLPAERAEGAWKYEEWPLCWLDGSRP